MTRRLRSLHATLIYCIAAAYASSRTFEPARSGALSLLANYVNDDQPCADDRLVFGGDRVVAAVDKDLLVSDMALPANGLIYFGDRVELGSIGGWQCMRRKTPETVYFKDDVSDLDAWSPSSWVARIRPPSQLHMNRVPGAKDSVVIPQPTHWQLFQPITVAEWVEPEKSVKARSTSQWTERLRSLEGQLAVTLGWQLATEYDTKSQLQLQRPIGDPIRVEKPETIGDEMRYGVKNMNGEQKNMANICAYVKCELEVASIECLDTFIPFGSCCPVCGGMLRVETLDGSLASLETALIVASQQFEKRFGERLDDLFDLSLERIDDSDFLYQYEVVVFPLSNMFSFSDMEVLDEERLEAVVYMIATNIIVIGKRSFKIIDRKLSKRDHSLRKSSIIAGSLLFSVLCLAALLVFLYREKKEAFVSFWSTAPSTLPWLVHFRTGKYGDGDVVELLQTDDGEGDLLSEEEVKSEDSNKAKAKEKRQESENATAVSFENRIFAFGEDDEKQEESSSQQMREVLF